MIVPKNVKVYIGKRVYKAGEELPGSYKNKKFEEKEKKDKSFMKKTDKVQEND